MELDSTGIDYEKAIERFAGNEGMFFKFLFRFPTEPTYQAILTDMRKITVNHYMNSFIH